MIDQRPVRRITASDRAPASYDAWPATVPAVEQLLREGWDLPGGVTLLVGLSPEGGSVQAQHATRRTESDLSDWIRLERGVGASRWGFFLRAETMHGFYSYLEDNPRTKGRLEPRFHEMSHGESFPALLGSRFDSPGLYCLDEPEAVL